MERDAMPMLWAGTKAFFLCGYSIRFLWACG